METISYSRESLASRVHRILRHAIITGELAPGSLHSVAKLAERLEVSRSPVREALISLADQGMVAFERNRGVRILQTTAHDLEEVFTLRLLLEVPATFRATQLMSVADVDRLRAALGKLEGFARPSDVLAHQQMDASFHRVILEAAGNGRLVALVDTLWSHQKMRGLTSVGRSRDPEDVHREHQAVFERVAAGDAHGAAAAMRRHLMTSASVLLAQETGEPPDASGTLPWLDVYSAVGGPGHA